MSEQREYFINFLNTKNGDIKTTATKVILSQDIISRGIEVDCIITQQGRITTRITIRDNHEGYIFDMNEKLHCYIYKKHEKKKEYN